jgi:3-deoxy-D-manno-octulosonic-acid transferase
MFFLYNILFPLLVLCYLPFYMVHCIRRGGLTVDFWERFGIFPAAVKARLRAFKAPLWIHAVSVGETVEALSFIQKWLEKDNAAEIVFSCGTATGFALAKKKLPAQVVAIYCPLDCWWMVWHAIKLIRPRLLALIEVEIWPNLIRQTHKFGAKVAMINGRMSDKSSAGYAKWRFVFKPVFDCFDALCVQTEEDRTRIERVVGAGDPRLHVVGTVKFDQVADVTGADVNTQLRQAFGDAPRVVFCAGSTHPGEEELMCKATAQLRQTHPEFRMVLVPRHAERGAEVVKVIEQCGLRWQAVKTIENTTPTPNSDADVLLVNTTGQLMSYYNAADICYVGKSLCGQTGGHNIIEPAIFGKAIIYGVHMENFRQVDEIFCKAQAGVKVADEASFIRELTNLVEQPEMRASLGAKARQVVETNRGAIERTIAIL